MVLDSSCWKIITWKSFFYFASLCLVFMLLSSYYNLIELSPSSIYSLGSFKEYYIGSSNDNATRNSTLSKVLEQINELIGSSESFFPPCNALKSNYTPFTVKLHGEYYPKSCALQMNTSIDFACLDRSAETKTILLWTPFFGDPDYSFGRGKVAPFAKNKCPVTKCELTDDKSRLAGADLVVTHMRDTVNIPSDLKRSERQRWVFLLYESPIHSPAFDRFNGFYNLTSTYKIESDFPGFYENYAGLFWQPNDRFNTSFDYMDGKTDFATAVISNCGGSSRRLELIKQLQKYIQVDVYGKCGKQCPTSYKNKTLGDCKVILAKEYKFYFAFENSICKDYITEKFFQILKHNIVPVVLGGGRYDHYIPKSGYIDVQDYATPKQLADYLVYLDANRTAYNEYFAWKKYVVFDNVQSPFSPLCDMCIQLHLEDHIGLKKQVIDDMGTYWNKKLNCKELQMQL